MSVPAIQSVFNIIFPVIFIFVLCFMGYVFYSALSGKGRSRMLSRQLKIGKQMLEDNKEDIKDLQRMSAELGIDAKKAILGDNEDALKDIASLEGDIESIGIKKKAQALKEGLLGEAVYCKYCGALIDADSRYCKKCGKEQ